MRKSFILFFLFLLITISYSQTQEQSTIEKLRQKQAQQGGTVVGKIRDEKSGENLIGASVSIINTKLGSSTDIDGQFEIKRVPEGMVDIRVSFIGYETKVITGVSVKMNEQTTLDVSLGEDQGIRQQEVVVSAEAIKSGEGAILAERKKASAIGDGISAEQMKRAPDATSGDALKRVTGLSVVDNKFVFIRGASERYNGTMLNGASVSSTEIGKKSFAFDMIPANLLENTTVVKSAAPDLPGDFTGGLVQMNTLDFPDHGMLKVALSSGINSVTTFKDMSRSPGGTHDWLGSDNGNRALPNFDNNYNELAQKLPNNWATHSSKAPLNSGLNISIGNKIDLSQETGEKQFGYIGALSYRNSYQHTIRSTDQFYTSRTLKGQVDNFSVLWGGILNLNYKSGFHKFSLKNSYNQTGDDEIRYLSGTDFGSSTEDHFTLVKWSERRTYSGTISGEHVIPELNGTTFEWKASVSSSRREDPDTKEITYFRSLDADPGTPFYAASPDNRRSWALLNGRNDDYNLNISIPVNSMKFKIGSFYDTRTTNYDINYYAAVANTYNGADLTQPIDIIYSHENFSSGKFSMQDISHPEDDYKGEQQLFAAYAMLDAPLSLLNNNFRLAGGARMENWYQKAIITTAGSSTNYDIKTIDVLPSANFTYLLNDVTNIRLAYSETVNRPEIRERAKSQIQDIIGKQIITGNPNLKRAYIHNYDVRFEIFPEAGEVFAVSGFYKRISHAIEEVYDLSLSQVYPTVTWQNAPNARNYGWEFELRKSLNFISDIFNDFSLTGNYTRIFSAVELTKIEGNSSDSYLVKYARPLQGQSPYMMNFGLFYTNPDFGTSVNILYNKFGARISTVGFNNTSDIYEQPREVVDFSVSQMILETVDLKFTVKNLLNKDRVLTQREELSGVAGKTRDYERSVVGVTYSLQLGLSF